jgi:tetratricopeptide (TPR) repeat protein
MNLEQLVDNFNMLNARIQSARDQMKSDSQHLIEEATNALFRVAPEIDYVFWQQYTPYFNDGESCTFSVCEIYYVLQGEEEDCEGSYLYTEQDYKDAINTLEKVRAYVSDPKAWFESYRQEHALPAHANMYVYRPWPYTVEAAQETADKIMAQQLKYTQPDIARINKAYEAFQKCMAVIPDDILEAVYGDHVRVTISRTGTSVDHYDHE